MEAKMYTWLLKVSDHSEPETKVSYINLYGLTEKEAIAKAREIKNEYISCRLYKLNCVL